jgi:ATP diphosphatase
MVAMQSSRDITRLIEIMAALRAPANGCPWDLAQTFETIVPYTIEEAYEVADAISRRNYLDLREELGDLLLQVVFHARLAEELGRFDFGGVVEAITEKMIRRHAHVFEGTKSRSIDEVETLWTKIKAEEKSAKSNRRSIDEIAGGDGFENDGYGSDSGILDGVALALPGLTRAVKLQAKAATVGFDWTDTRPVLAKIREETEEVEAVLDTNDRHALIDEIGDLFFAVANLARHARVDPENAIRHANNKFERRFRFIEQELGRTGRDFRGVTLDEMEALWGEAKKQERDQPDS